MIHTVKGFGIVNKAEIDVFLELSCFFHDPADVGNLISGSSSFSKTSLIADSVQSTNQGPHTQPWVDQVEVAVGMGFRYCAGAQGRKC